MDVRTAGSSSGSSSSAALAAPITLAAPTAATPAAAAGAPHFLGDDTGGAALEIAAGTAAVRLATSSSSARFLASAWRSLHVNLPLGDERGAGADWAASAACARASKGLLSFLGF